MPSQLSERILEQYWKLGDFAESLGHFQGFLTIAANHLVNDDAVSAGNAMLGAIAWMEFALEDLDNGVEGYRYKEYRTLSWINNMWPSDGEEYELTMEKIIFQMLLADPPEVMMFVGIADAYRQSIWNREFDENLYGTLAKAFALWG